jgi:hypothetical protein
VICARDGPSGHVAVCGQWFKKIWGIVSKVRLLGHILLEETSTSMLASSDLKCHAMIQDVGRFDWCKQESGCGTWWTDCECWDDGLGLGPILKRGVCLSIELCSGSLMNQEKDTWSGVKYYAKVLWESGGRRWRHNNCRARHNFVPLLRVAGVLPAPIDQPK